LSDPVLGTAPISGESWAKTTTILLAANVLRNVGLIVILVLLARLTSQEVVGRYSLALAITGPIFVFAQLGLRGVYLTLRSDHRFSSYLYVQLFAVGVALLVSVALTPLFSPALILTVALVAAIKVGDALVDLLSGPLQKYHLAPRILLASTASAILGSAVTATTLVLTGSLEAALAGLAFSSTVVVVTLLWIPSVRLTRAREDATHASVTPREDRKAILLAGLPTGFSAATLALVSSMPQFFLAASHGTAVVGHFAVLLYVIALVDIFAGTLAQAWIPRARESLAAVNGHQSDFVRIALKTTFKWMLALAPLAVIGLWVMSALLPVLFGANYTLSLEMAVPLACTIIVLPVAHFGGISVAVKNYYFHGITLSVAAAAISFVGCLLLVPPFSITGALWSTALAFASRGVVSFGILALHARRDDR
jgi:O-antigen/teichoic acid export membrane protein